MTVIVADAAASTGLAAEIDSFLSRIAGSATMTGLLNSSSGAAEMVLTDRLPASASYVDQTTGDRIVVTDPDQVKALLSGPYAYVSADSSGAAATTDVRFDWGADMDGKPVLYVGGITAEPDHVLHFAGMYGIDNSYDVGRALAEGLARSFSDSVGGMRSDALGVDHGQALVQSFDWNGWMNQGTDAGNPQFYVQGPIGFDANYGDSFDFGLSRSTNVVFEGLVGGGYRTIATTGRDSSSSDAVYTQTHFAVGTTILGQTYETYVLNELDLGGRHLLEGQVNGGLVATDDLGWATGEMGGYGLNGNGLAYAAQSVYQLDLGIRRDDGVDTSDVARDVGVGLGLWGFAQGYSFDHSRVVGVDVNREINVTTHGVAYGAQVLGGDVVYDAGGPTAFSTSTTAAVLAIDDSAATTDSIIVGAGGAPNWLNPAFDSTTSVDLIQAGHGDDIVLVGDGYDPNGLMVNVAHGNDGSDILVGGISNDHLFGDAGNDMLVVSDGVDVLDGGDGFDVADASQAFGWMGDIGVTYDAATGLLTGERTSTTLVNIERVNGTVYSDVLKGGPGMVMDGGQGDDVIHVGAGGIGIGGEGDDQYHVALAASGYEKVLLLGFDQGDTLWLDGVQHLGSTDGAPSPWNTAAQNPDDYWTDTLLSDGQTDGFATIRLEHYVGGQISATTDVVIAGFAQGDGGIVYDHSTQWDVGTSDVIGMFMGAGYLPQDQMFGLV